MRRFSQRSALVTLSEINITPLLDLAFVLLIIFVITTPLLEQGLPLKLPGGGQPDRQLDRKDIQTVEISDHGLYFLQGRKMPLPQIEKELVAAYKANPKLLIYIRGDENSPYKYVANLMDRCEHHGITSYSFRTGGPEPVKR